MASERYDERKNSRVKRHRERSRDGYFFDATKQHGS